MQSPYKVDAKFRGRAVESIQRQSKILSEDPRPELQTKRRQQQQASDELNASSNAEKLRTMLLNLPSDAERPPHADERRNPASPVHRCLPDDGGNVPSPEETMLVLEHQTVYAQQLENELHFAKEELATVKVKLSEVMQENIRLQSDLRRNIVKEIISEECSVTELGALPAGSSRGREGLPAVVAAAAAGHGSLAAKADFGKWQQELDRISALHKSRNEALEAQLSYSKDELLRCRVLIDELQSKLRQQESLAALLSSAGGGGSPTGGGAAADDRQTQRRLCVACARAPAVALAGTTPAAQQAEWEQVCREREDAVDALSRAMSQLDAAQSREDDARDRVRACIELLEQTQREKGEVVVQREQIRDELERTRQRCEAAVADLQRQLADAKESAKNERQHEVAELEIRLKHANEEEATSKAELLRLVRDRRDTEQQLQQAKLLAQQSEVAVAEATSRLRVELSRMGLERDAAIEERSKLKINMKKMESSHDEAVDRLRHEVDALRRRLDAAEHSTLTGKEEAIKLVTENQRLEKELAAAKMTFTNLQHDRNDELAAMASRLEQRERELTSQLQASEHQLSLCKHELHHKVEAQSNLIDKLREECRRQASIIESTSGKHRTQTRQMRKNAKSLTDQLSSAQQAIQRLNQQITEHVRVHDHLRDRIAESDGSVQQLTHQSNQLHSTNQELSRELEILNNEIRLLRVYAANGGDAAVRSGAASVQGAQRQPAPRPSGMINDILAALSSDMADQDRTLQNGILILRQAAANSHDPS